MQGLRRRVVYVTLYELIATVAASVGLALFSDSGLQRAVVAAVLSSVVAVVYSNTIRSQAVMTQLPEQLRAPVTDSIGGAYEAVGKSVAAGLMEPAQAAVVEAAAVDSFMRAFHAAAFGSAVLVLIALVVSVARLPAEPEEADWEDAAGSPAAATADPPAGSS